MTASQQTQHTTVLPGTSTVPAVGSRSDRDDDRDGRGGRALGYALLGLAVLAVFVIAALIARSVLDGSGGEDISVPDVGGLTVADARTTLQAEDLELGTETPKASDTVPEGNIIDQSPESGTMVKDGAAVSVTVSTGADEAVVPSLVGLSLDEARQALNQAGLELGETDPVASDETRNTVTRVSPKEGETVPAGSKVDLRYASGNNKVPDVEGQDEATARNMIEQAGFTVATREEESAEAPGSVIRQTPAAKETLRLGSTVTITVATAPPETETPEPPPPSSETPLPTDTATPLS